MLGKVTDWVIILMSFAILAAIVLIGWSDLIDGKIYKPVIEFGTRSSGPTHHVMKLTYKPGEMVTARVLIQKQRNLIGTIHWALVDGTVIQFPMRSGSLPMGIYDGVVDVERLPANIAPGEYWFAGTVSYQVNWMSSVTYPLWSDKFRVVK